VSRACVAFLCAVMLFTSSCLGLEDIDPQSAPHLRMSTSFGKEVYFEGEPIALVLQLTNAGPDTAWVAPFSVVAAFVDGALETSQGEQVPHWGLIGDLALGPDWRGIPVPPHDTLFDVLLLQDQWGRYDPERGLLYRSHHIPVGRYTFRAWFYWNPSNVPSSPVQAETLAFAVIPKEAPEEALEAPVRTLVVIFGDSLRRPTFLANLVDLLESQATADPAGPFVPYLATRLMSKAYAMGLALDDTIMERVNAARFMAAGAQRSNPAGAVVAVGLRADSPTLLCPLADVLGNSLTTSVARRLAGACPLPAR
jgi:hypothetical protein